MKVLLLLLLLAGLCSGIQFPLQYVYHYRAKVSSGIPDINKRHWAVSELKANLSVFVTSPTNIVFKLSDVSFSDNNGLKDCDHGKGESAATSQLASQLGQFPFSVENGVLTFNAQEKPWAINFYKSIVSVFNIAPLKEAFYKTSRNHSFSAAYDKTEDTVMGKCRTTYTQHKLTGVAAAQRELFSDHHVTQDVQKGTLGEYANPGTSKTTKTTGRKRRQASKRPPSKTSKTPPRLQQAPAISNTVWEVVRSVNLDDCEDRVEHQHSLGGLYCLLSKDQCQNLYSRSSHGAYYLRGDANGMRLEKAKIRGAIVISPFGFETEHIETITSQMLGLVSVNHLDIDAPNLTGDTTVTTDKLVYELTLPYVGVESPNYRWAKKGTMKQTIAALTGVIITEDIQRQNEARVIKMLKDAAELAASGSSGATQPAPVVLNYASILMYDFTKEEITRVATGLPQASLELFFGVLTEVGSAPAVEVMLELIKNGKVSALRQVVFFGGLNINIKSAASLRPILNFLKSQNLDAAPFKTSQSLINFASVVNKLCLGRRDSANSFKEFAYQKCAQDGIVADLRGHITSELQGAADKFWKQMVLVQALVNLKSVESTNALLPYVLGARECDTMVRAVAMDSLAKWNAANPLYKSKIVLILLDIFENPAESRLLRARALGYLASWELSSTEWTRLAFTTKRHGLKDLSAMTYSLIKATAEFEHPEMVQQRQYARHALSLAKPSSAADRYSGIKAWLSYAFGSQVGQINHFSEVQDPMSPLPAELSIYIQRSLGGAVFFKKMDFMIANDNGDLEDIANELFLGITLPNRAFSARGPWTNFINMVKTDLNIEAKLKTAIRGLANFLSTSQARLFIPFERVMLVDAIKSISGDRAPNLRLNGPSSMYINSVDNRFITVNDLGLPVIIKVAQPSVIRFEGAANVQNSGLYEYRLEFVSFQFFASSSIHVNIETMIPWSQSTVVAGVSNMATLNIPLSPTLEFSWNQDKQKSSFLIVNLAPSVFEKTALLTRMNVPYTLIRGTAPTDIEDVLRALRVVYVNGEEPKYSAARSIYFMTLEEITADSAVSFSSGDSLFSSSSRSGINLEKLVLFPSLMYYGSTVSADFTGMQTYSVRLNFTSATADRLSNAGKLVSKYGQDRFQDHELCGHEGSGDEFTQQTGQNAIEDYDEQDSQSTQNPEQEFESFGSVGQQQSQTPAKLTDPTDAETTRPSQGIGDVSQPQLDSFLKYLQRQAGWKSWVRGLSLRFEVLKGGVSWMAHEAVAAETKCYALAGQVLTKSVLFTGRTGGPCDNVCFESEVTRPKINDLDTLPLLLSKNLNLTGKLDIYTGIKCSEGPILTLTAKASLTGAGRQRLVEKLDDLQKCGSHWGRPQNLVKEFAETAEYDRMEYSTNVKTIDIVQCKAPILQLLIPHGWTWIRKTIFNLIQNFDFSPGDFGPTGMQFSGSAESSEDKTWKWKEQFGEKKLTQSTSALPFWVDDAVKIGHQSDYHGHGDYCVIDGQKITTFDGMRINFTAIACPVLVSTPCEGHADVFAVAVKTSSSGGLAVHVAGQIKQFIINVNAAGIDINGVPMKADEYVKPIHYYYAARQQLAGYLYKRNGFYKVEIDDTVNVLLKEGKVYIEVADRYRGYMCGMCGNFDEEPSNDLKAPNGCLITDSEQFAKAWTPTVGFECTSEQQTNPDTCLKEEPLPRDYYQQYQL